MLLSLKVTNVALIEDIEVQFEKGFNILSGETGAGKSIILDSIALILGEQGRVEFIRSGKEEAKILAIFDLEGSTDIKDYLREEMGIETPENLLFIERSIFRDKRPSLAFVNHQRALVQGLKNIGNKLLNIHSQHQNQSLFDSSQHLKILDKYLGLSSEVALYKEKFDEAIALKKELTLLRERKQEAEEKKSFYAFSYEELKEADLQFNEISLLEEELHLFNENQNTLELINEADEILSQNDQSITSSLNLLARLFTKINDKTDDAITITPFIDESLIKLEPVLDFIRAYKSKMDFSQDEIEEKKARFSYLKELERKYKKTISELLDYEKELSLLLEEDDFEEKMNDISKKREEIQTELTHIALSLSQKRKAGSLKLEEAIKQELIFLKLPHTQFKVQFTENEDPKGSVLLENGKKLRLLREGIEKGEFLISFNKGEELKPLSRVASGGEVSRVMLALKIVFLEIESINTQIFDEVDTGIGGETALAVGQKLLDLSQKCQIICITHLPQIAAMGNLHYKVTKIIENERTQTIIIHLTEEDRVNEISRMLSGDSITETSLKHAKELLDYKKRI